MHWIEQRIAENGPLTAMVHDGKEWSYAVLLERIRHLREAFESKGVKAGDVVAIDGDYSPESVAAIVAAFLMRTIVVPLASIVEAQKPQYLDIAEVRHVVTLDEGGAWNFATRECEASHPLIIKLRETGNAGLILFSSGSTGASKASLLDFDALTDKFQERRRGFRALVFLMLDHIGGINTLFHALAQGGTIITARSRAPRDVCEAIAAHKAGLLPTSPTFLNMLLISEAYKDFDLSSLEIITYGTEPMPPLTLKALHEALPSVQLKQTYGLSEVGIMATQSKSSDSLWLKLGGPGFEHRIVDKILHIRSKSAMLGYLNAPSPFDEDGWMNTRDVVEVDGEYIRILGRDSEIINVGGLKVFPQQVEAAILELPEVLDVTVFGKANAVMGKVVVAKVRPRDPDANAAALKRTVQEHCRARLEPHMVPMRVEVSADEQHSSRFKKARSAVADSV